MNESMDQLQISVLEDAGDEYTGPINPPVDPGYHPPPLEPVPYEDVFAGLEERSKAEIKEALLKLRALPPERIHRVKTNLKATPHGQNFGPALERLFQACMDKNLNPVKALTECRSEELQLLFDCISKIGQRKYPPEKLEALKDDQQILMLFVQVLQAEGLRRNS